ncbi:MAG: VOC family protein [Gammaproteobacteria bacterium]|nr:VOC family protein [Gammaproteobacteria bacterium]
MAIQSLAYLGIRSNKLDEWSTFATKLLGMQPVDPAGKNRTFRMDDHKQRFVVSDEAGDDIAFIAWEVESPDDLDAFASSLEQQQIGVTRGTRDLCSRRMVEQLIAFDDPDGNRLELVYKPEITTEKFIPGRPISGFITGAYGMGHAVLHVRDAEKLLPFYRDTLGFQVSDFGLLPYPLYFFHVNGRHHSFAMVGSGQTGFHHFMVEYGELDDVGQSYDLAQQHDDLIAYTLGRHTNDYMTSYYAHTPSGFFIESGWGGRIIDPASWQPQETHTGPSFWGHDRTYMSDSDRDKFRQMRLAAAREGQRAPPLVDCPWLYSTSGANRMMHARTDKKRS